MAVRDLRPREGISWPDINGDGFRRRWATSSLRRRYAAEVNDDSWRKELKPIKSHPRKDKRRPSRPR